MKLHLITGALLGVAAIFVIGFNSFDATKNYPSGESDRKESIRFVIENERAGTLKRNEVTVKINVIEKNSGKSIYNSVLKLIHENNKLVTPVLHLKPGNYQLQEFLIIPSEEGSNNSILNKGKNILLPFSFTV